MKFLFLILNLLTDHEAIVAVMRCCFASAVTNLSLLFVLGAYQGIRLSIHRHRSQVQRA